MIVVDTFVGNQLNIDVWFCFWAFYSVPLNYIPLLCQYYAVFHFCSFIGILKSDSVIPSAFCLIVSLLNNTSVVWVYCSSRNLRILFSIYEEKSMGLLEILLNLYIIFTSIGILAVFIIQFMNPGYPPIYLCLQFLSSIFYNFQSVTLYCLNMLFFFCRFSKWDCWFVFQIASQYIGKLLIFVLSLCLATYVIIIII